MKCTRHRAAAAAAALNAATASAATTTACPGDSQDVCYGWGVPSTAASSSSDSSVYFQLTAPTSYQWVALGIGSSMMGSDIFVMYQDGGGNVTLSPRRGEGHVMPQFAERDDVQLLDGSGVQGEQMVANVRCGQCDNVDPAGPGSWIAAWKAGQPLNSASASEAINFHDEKVVFEVDMAQAGISSDSNPFVGSSPDKGGGPGSGSDSGVSETGGGGGGGNMTLLLAHGVIMTLVFAVLYPMGSILIPLVSKWFIHASWQTIAFLLMWAGFGIGYTISERSGLFFMQAHTRLGTIVVALMGLQPVLGWAHHLQFRKTGSRSLISHAHIWYGRALMVLGVVNGGLGLKLATAGNDFVIAYSVLAGVFGLAYVAGAVFGARKAVLRREKEVSPVGTHESRA